MIDPVVGRVPAEPGSCEPSPAVSALPGFDPSRIVPWPDDGGPLDFEKIGRPILHAIRFAYELKRRDKRLNIPWRGPEIGWREQATCPTITERLKAHRLTYTENDQGRDALQEIVTAAIQLGIEQGRRLARSDTSRLLDEAARSKFTVLVGWDDFTHVHTETGLIAEPVPSLQKAITALVDEMAQVQRCPRQRAISFRDSDGSGEAGETAGLVPKGDSAGRQASPGDAA